MKFKNWNKIAGICIMSMFIMTAMSVSVSGETLYQIELRIRYYKAETHDLFGNEGEFELMYGVKRDGSTQDLGFIRHTIFTGYVGTTYWFVAFSEDDAITIDSNDQILFNLYEVDWNGNEWVVPGNSYYRYWNPPNTLGEHTKRFYENSDRTGCWVELKVEILSIG